MAIVVQFYDTEKALNVKPTFDEAWEAIEEWEHYELFVEFMHQKLTTPVASEVAHEAHSVSDEVAPANTSPEPPAPAVDNTEPAPETSTTDATPTSEEGSVNSESSTASVSEE